MLHSEQLIQELDVAIQHQNANKLPEAMGAFTDFLLKNDKIALAWNNRGLALMRLGHPFDGILNIDKAIELEPLVAEYHLNKGACYMECEQTEKAMENYRKCIELNPNIAVAYMNLGNAFRYLGKPEEALPYYRICTEKDPNYADGQFNRATGELVLGNFKEGWEAFEWRWRTDQLVPRGLDIKQWNGEDITGKTLFVYGEQGHGDSLQFMRYASLIKERFNAGKVIVEVRQPLARLVKTLPNIDQVVIFGEEVRHKEIDYMSAVMSLPRIFGTTMETIPWFGPYFSANQFRVNMWRDKLKALPPGLLVGVCWAGLSRPSRPMADAIDRRRSTTLSTFAPLAKVPGISWVSLQKGVPRDQVEKPPTGMTIGDWTEELDDFYDTAALIECLDLVITVDTAIVHLAAALGKPTWLLSRWDGCWRWLGTRSDSPWYPSLRQFTQDKPHSWGPMMEKAAIELRLWVKERQKKAA